MDRGFTCEENIFKRWASSGQQYLPDAQNQTYVQPSIDRIRFVDSMSQFLRLLVVRPEYGYGITRPHITSVESRAPAHNKDF